MSLEKIIEEKIQEAMANGEFDNLEGAGKPQNLDEYFAAPEDVRVGYSLLKSNKFVPPEVDLLKEIGELKEKAGASVDGDEKSKLAKLLNEKILALTIILERNKRKNQ
ncbi:MAG: DUF1992 domain-containing protein [Blastocatellia bacterium]|nr:DUF1992 domain-containing protein [Blastocatellia bacterium]